MRYSCISDGHTLPEFQALKGFHAAENLETAIRNLRHAGIISSQILESGYMLCCSIPCVAAIHAIERFQIFALAHIAEARIGNVNRDELTQFPEARQCREGAILHQLATNAYTA